MKPIKQLRFVLFSFFMLATFTTMAQTETKSKKENEPQMKTYLIERDIPGAGQLTAADLKGISQKSCSVITLIGPKIKWLHSYVTGNKIYCVYMAENESLLREHGKKGGFPVTNITEIATTIGPATANE